MQALKCLDAVPAERAGEVLQLQAQLHFRLGNETQCVEAYKQLTQDHKVCALPLATCAWPCASAAACSLLPLPPSLQASYRTLHFCPSHPKPHAPSRACYAQAAAPTTPEHTLLLPSLPQVESAELQANILAAYVAGHLAAQLPQVMSALKISPRASFEVTFNTACGLLQLGDLAGAEAELRAGLKIGKGQGPDAL